MKSIAKLMKVFTPAAKAPDTLHSSKGPPDITLKCVQGLKKAVKFLETNLESAEGIFSKAGSIEEVSAIVEFIQNNSLSESYLSTLTNKHSVAMAMKEILATYSPLIPSNQYDHFMSPLADYEQLVEKIRHLNGGGLEVVMKFLWKLVHYDRFRADPANLTRNIGIFILRTDKAELYSTNARQSAQTHLKAFTAIIEAFPCTDEESKRQISDPNAKQSGDAAAPVVVVDASAVSIQDRSVKVSFLNPSNKPTQQSLRDDLSRYGEVVNIGLKEKLAVVLFMDPMAAIRCAEDRDGRALADCRVS